MKRMFKKFHSNVGVFCSPGGERMDIFWNLTLSKKIFTHSFCPAKLLFCFMKCPRILAVFSLQYFLLVSANSNKFLHHGDVCLNLVVHQRNLLILFLGFTNWLSVTFNLCFYCLNSLSLQTAQEKSSISSYWCLFHDGSRTHYKRDCKFQRLYNCGSWSAHTYIHCD